MKRWTKRRYFKFVWTPSNIAGVLPIVDQPLVIFGYEDDSEYDEDHAYIDLSLMRGRIYGRWFSVQCLHGDIGTNLLDRMTEITKEEFQWAQQHDFKVEGEKDD